MPKAIFYLIKGDYKHLVLSYCPMDWRRVGCDQPGTSKPQTFRV